MSAHDSVDMLAGSAWSDGPVLLDISGHIAHVRLNRPSRMNAIDLPMMTALSKVSAVLGNETDLRAVILSGEGRAFCGGIDLANFSNQAHRDRLLAELAKRNADGTNMAQHAAMQWRRLDVPVIAAIHGVAYGGGLQIALSADLRFATADAQLSVREIEWGLIPDMGGTWLLRGLVRDDIAADLLFTGRIVSGEQASALGLVTRVCQDPLSEALAVANEIAGRSPDAVRAAKRILAIANDRAPERVLRAETEEQLVLLKSSNHRQAVAAALAREVPRFTPAPSNKG